MLKRWIEGSGKRPNVLCNQLVKQKSTHKLRITEAKGIR